MTPESYNYAIVIIPIRILLLSSLQILNIAPNSYSETSQQVSHSMGSPANLALVIGLPLTPLSSICFCLQRALKSRSLQRDSQRWKKQITSHARRVGNPHNGRGEAAHGRLLWRLLISPSLLLASPSWVCWRSLARGKAEEAAGALQTEAPGVTCKPRLRHGACPIPLSPGLFPQSLDSDNSKQT